MKRVLRYEPSIVDEVVERISYRFSLVGDNNDERRYIREDAVPTWLDRNIHVDVDGVMYHIYTDDGYDFGKHPKQFWWRDKFNHRCELLAYRWYEDNKLTIKDATGQDRRDHDIYEYAYYLAEWCLENTGSYDADNIAHQAMKKFNISSDNQKVLNDLVDFLAN